MAWLQVSLSSRVGCIGGNGAGKSTMIKVLTGELEQTEGNVWRHPNCRIAYVAQHAFHHIEKHLDKTPNQYIQWRYVSGEDREEQEKSHIAMTEEEIAAMHQKIKLDDGSKRSVEKLVSRRKAKGGGYECAPAPETLTLNSCDLFPCIVSLSSAVRWGVEGGVLAACMQV